MFPSTADFDPDLLPLFAADGVPVLFGVSASDPRASAEEEAMLSLAVLLLLPWVAAAELGAVDILRRFL